MPGLAHRALARRVGAGQRRADALAGALELGRAQREHGLLDRRRGVIAARRPGRRRSRTRPAIAGVERRRWPSPGPGLAVDVAATPPPNVARMNTLPFGVTLAPPVPAGNGRQRARPGLAEAAARAPARPRGVRQRDRHVDRRRRDERPVGVVGDGRVGDRLERDDLHALRRCRRRRARSRPWPWISLSPGLRMPEFVAVLGDPVGQPRVRRRPR